MSTKNLFNKSTTIQNAATGSKLVESKDFILKKIEQEQTFVPYVNFASASNFVKYGSAKEYYSTSIKRIYSDYPYDGSQKEKINFELSSSYLDNWMFDYKYPKTTGYVDLSYGGWGTASSIIDGFGLPNTSSAYEYIYVAGGIHTASAGMIGQPLYKVFDKSVIYDTTADRTTPFVINPANGLTVEFWLKKQAFDITKTEKEIVLDLWNGNVSSSVDYGRFTLALTSSGESDGTNTFIATLQSGTYGFYEQALGSSTVTTSSLSSWHHYALSFQSASAGVSGRIYVDGTLNESKTLGSTGVNTVGGLVNGHIGALITSPSSSNGAVTGVKYAGKLSASLDDFRYWKTRRTSEQIYNNWYDHVGGGTNTDDANINLGVYYKFNEGIVGVAATDSKVLDYSGRISNGTWTGYTSGARSTSSAFTESGLVASESPDPIIYNANPRVSSLITEMETSGSNYDYQNGTMMYNTLPQWIRDADNSDTTKQLLQIVSSYFDTLHAQITALPLLKNKVYPSASYKPLPFAERLLEDKGMITPSLFVNSSVMEQYGDKDANQITFEKNLNQTKNLIYTNIYNNLDFIYKSKGTESSIRNMLRCFGIDDKIVKLNVYTDKGTHYFSDKTSQTSDNKKYINLNQKTLLNATIFQTSSTNNTLTYLSGSGTQKLERYAAFTAETNIIIPKKLEFADPSFFFTPFLSSSVFGMHQAVTSSNAYTWETDEIANFQVYVVRDERESDTAKFVLKNQDGSINLETGFYNELYGNQNWNLAVRVKPNDYPYAGNVVTSSASEYTLEFYGVTHAFNTVETQFTLTASMNYASGSSFMSNPKRFYLGTHKTNFTGSNLQSTDLKFGRFNFWLDYLDNEIINQHNLDIVNHGNYRTVRASSMFLNNLENILVPSYELAGIDWDFETVTTSDGSGEFSVSDVTSGSTDTRYGWIDDITRRENNGLGYGFAANNTSFIANEFVFSNRKELPEISYTSDGVTIKGEKQEYFIKDPDVSDSFFSLEKSMYSVISEEMLEMFSSVREFSTLIGQAVDRYRLEYKNLKFLRGLFFEDVESDPDFDRYTEYFKWIDSSISKMTTQLFPVSTRHSVDITDVIESHILERNKYQNKFPLVKTIPSTEGIAQGVSFAKYKWRTGHAPIPDSPNENCVWQKERKKRTDIPDRETIREAIVNDNNAKPPKLAQSNGTVYEGSTFALRRLSRPYSLSQGLQNTLHGGTNYSLQKDRDYLKSATYRAGPKTSIGIPKNVVVVGINGEKGIEKRQDCDDVNNPSKKDFFNIKAYVGQYAGSTGPTVYPFNDSGSYLFGVTGQRLPMNIKSGSLNSGYNANVYDGYNQEAIFTNLHEDTTYFSNDVPMQSPFTNQWVGGRQARHVDLNKFDTSLRDDFLGGSTPNNLDNQYTRPEEWRLLISSSTGNGMFGFTGPDYGGPYPDPTRKSAVYYRGMRTKRPVNIDNIQTTTASQNYGNFTSNLEVVSTTGKLTNNLYFVDNSAQTNYLPQSVIDSLPQTTNPMTLLGISPLVEGNVFGVYPNNRQPDTSLLSPEITGTAASGSFVVTGGYNAGAQASNATFRVYSPTGSQFTNNEGIKILDGAGNDKRFFFPITGTIPPDSAPNYYIATGSNDTDFWNNLETKIEAQTPFSTSYSALTSTSDGMYFSSSNPGSSINIGTLPTQFTASSFTFSGWVNVAAASPARDRYFFQFENASGDISRELFLSSSGELTYRAYGANGANRCTASWGYVGFEGTYAGSLVHVAVTHNQGSGFAGSANIYVNAVSQSIVSALIASSAGACTGASFMISNGAGFITNNVTSDSGFIGSGSNFSFWADDLPVSQVSHLYNSGHFFDIESGNYCAFPAMPTHRIAWFPMTKISSANTEEIFGNSYALTNRGNFLDRSGPPNLPYANFTMTAPATGSAYNITLANSGFGSVATCGTVSNLSNGTGGTDYQGAYPSGSIVLDKTFAMAATAVGPVIAVPEFTDTNTAFWNALSQSIKDNTVYDTITVDTSAGHQAVFHLTASETGSAHNNTITTSGPNANLTFPGTEIGFSGGTNIVPAIYDPLDIVIETITGSVTQTVISSRFSAPGGPEIQSYGYLDAYSHEYSAYNHLVFRNYTVRYIAGGKASANEIGLISESGGDGDSLQTLFTRPSGKFGNYNTASSVPELTYLTNPSYFKQQRNTNRRIQSGSALLSPTFVVGYDNMSITSLIPRSDFQYTWITGTLANDYSYKSGKQRVFGYSPKSGILSSSVIIDGDSGFVPAITFPTASEIFGD